MDHLLANNLFDVSDRIALVTGGGSGIGLMIAQALAANGAKVYVGSRKSEKVESSAEEYTPKITGQIIPIGLDVTDKESIKNAVKIITDSKFKGSSMCCAGMSGPHSNFLYDPSAPEQKDPEAFGNGLFNEEFGAEWANTFGLNVASIFFMTSAFLGLLNKASETRGAWSSSVINISSVSGQLRISENHFSYNASKAAAIHLTHMFATEFALKNIQVNSIAPGVHPSEMTHVQGKRALSGEKASSIGKALRDIPFQRSGTDTDMGGAALFLSSPASYYVHGQVITVDGGFKAVHPAT
ncbi:Short-chain dehydrogenase [Ceratobasidium theobromae]|uniref:Short-chain dehydrogenase n=1 Tax=Ceratobasidium theobromae TaxID=1582974 RepID=A0A5N5QK64_9AGAM|nr:Short-chain dehydrogenase [Ceratobasidium theobromae]